MQTINLNVLKIHQQDSEFFVGVISAKELVDISFSDVRRIKSEQRDVEKYLGIQRPLDENRVKKIKQYIQSPDATFPTGIVLAVNPNCATFDQDNNTLQLSPFLNPEFENDDEIPVHKIAKVLDGQHRIAAFMNDSGTYDFTLDIKDFQLNVVIFVGLDIDEQANIFATINLAQTKVNKSLVYDLEGLSRIRSPFKSAHQISVALDSATEKSPLYHRIKRLGVKTKGRENNEPLTQAVFVESLIKFISSDSFIDRTLALKNKKIPLASIEELKKLPFRNLFLENKDDDITLILFNYFSAIENKWEKAWNDLDTTGNILPKSNAFKAFMRFLKPLYLNIVGNDIGRIVTQNEFSKHFTTYTISDSDFTSGNFKPGSGGESSFYKVLQGELTINDLKNI